MNTFHMFLQMAGRHVIVVGGGEQTAPAMTREATAGVNVMDRPALCNALAPPGVNRDPAMAEIPTRGMASGLARRIRTAMGTLPKLGLSDLAVLADRLHLEVTRCPSWRDGRCFRNQVVNNTPAAGGTDPVQGSIALVGAGPGAADLLTLRALRLLQEADVIYHDRLVEPAVLELARREAERVFVGKEVGACTWPQDRINAVILAAARQGRRVVRLKSGDPGIFGRATEELDAARAAGITVEIVPGVTAASAAAASLGRGLTERGATDRLLLATATCRPGDPDPDWATMLKPGTTLAIYMGVRKAPEFTRQLRNAGVPMGLEVEIVSHASTARETITRCTLSALAQAMGDGRIDNPAIIFIRWAKRENMLPQAVIRTALRAVD
ncbi:uroporphyrin-III C-methyltransferase / precorrin-2 dehydrogenase / sirohydrochlorin ferrochelatase [Roseovarius azorensis]|uniref:uroporphyrinogen-III C-methyltransferase n=1 Tax=Roseovarius azorensis TaxID=1287727 RepID=A0A1H7V360_9RHOB|nr:uroporphyrinogen-III C-methyltransferase [Roseovarius azorensis]SEM03157.1 uroporphyrin-III C-methyltransferase / precorrin-2 dehydrogenase / sirohydrochlorin ferrochelatase [Roseovarius azorensis]